jgi:hypothetical protein
MLRFSLRTLLIVVTALAVPMAWAGYSLRWIAERHDRLERGQWIDHVMHGAPEWTLHKNGVRRAGQWCIDDSWPARTRAPCGLWLFGEQGYEFLIYDGLRQEMIEAERLFPEATISHAEDVTF